MNFLDYQEVEKSHTSTVAIASLICAAIAGVSLGGGLYFASLRSNAVAEFAYSIGLPVLAQEKVQVIVVLEPVEDEETIITAPVEKYDPNASLPVAKDRPAQVQEEQASVVVGEEESIRSL